MTPLDDRYAAWRCANCQKEYAVPGLARDCEARHDAQLAALYGDGDGHVSERA